MENYSICQCCLTDDTPMKNMLVETYQDVKLIENFEKCSGIDLFKDQPKETCKNICLNCEINLKICIEFRELCRTSQQMLKERLAIIKEEPLHDDEDEPLVIYSSRKRGSTRSSEIFAHEVFVKVLPEELIIPKLEDDVQDETVPPDENSKDDYFNNDNFTGRDSDSDDNGASPTKIVKSEKLNPDEVKTEPPVEDETLTMPVLIMCNRCDQFLSTLKEFFAHRNAHLTELNIKISQCHINRKCYVCHKDVLGYTKHLMTEHRDFKPHKCKVCDLSVDTTNTLAKHLYTHAKAKLFKCLGCKKNFKSKAVLRSHISTEKHSKISYHCIACGLGFKEFNFLSDHYKNEHANEFYRNLYPCFRCKRVFIYKELARNHSNCERVKTMKLKHERHNCPKCKKQFTSEDEMVCHKITLCQPPPKVKKEVTIKLHNCPECDEEFANNDEMLIHQNTVCKKTFACRFPYCGKHFLTKGRRNRHFGRIHTPKPILEEKYVCDVCGAEIRSKGHLAKHKLVQHNPDFVKKQLHFKCNVPGCGKVLLTKLGFAKHNILQHSERQYFECDVCQKKFRSIEMIRTHVVEHSANPDELLSFVCDFCQKRFVDQRSLNVHLRTHTSTVVNRVPVSCDQCSKTFERPDQLANHIKRIHDGIYYECSYCQFYYSTHSAIKCHLQEHQGFRPFHCTHCPEQFFKRYVFVQHLNKHGIEFDKRIHNYVESDDLKLLVKSCKRMGQMPRNPNQPQRLRFSNKTKAESREYGWNLTEAKYDKKIQ